jgi:hypothetical protein
MEWALANIVYVIGGVWAGGMGLYIWLSQFNKYNNKHYMDIKDFKRQFKKHRDELNGVEKKSFK